MVKILKGNNDLELINRGVNRELIYFYQQWQELVDNRTLDAYQYRILNSYIAVYELIDVINKTIDGLYNTDHNIDSCREETLYILNQDDVLLKHEIALLNRLRTHIGKKTSTIYEKKSLKFQLQYALNKMSTNYLNLLLDD